MKHLYIYGAVYPDIVKLVDAINNAWVEKRFPGVPIWKLAGFIDDTLSKQGTQYMGIPVIGGKEVLPDIDKYSSWFINNVGSTTAAREKVSQIMIKAGCRFATLIHPKVDTSYTTIGEGTIISNGAVLGANVKIGKHCAVRSNALVNHDNLIGDYCFIGPGATLSGYVTLENQVFLGVGVSVRERIVIGKGALVGAGAAVIRDVEPGNVVVGVPAKRL